MLPLGPKEIRLAIAERQTVKKLKLMNLLLTLRLGKDHELIPKAQNVANLIGLVEHERNVIIHGVWSKDLKTGRYVQLWSKGKLEGVDRRILPEAKPLTPKDALAVRQSMENINAALDAFRAQLASELAKSHEVTPNH